MLPFYLKIIIHIVILLIISVLGFLVINSRKHLAITKYNQHEIDRCATMIDNLFTRLEEDLTKNEKIENTNIDEVIK